VNKVIEFPCNIEAEMVVLGSSMLSDKNVDYVAQNLSPKEFFDHRHKVIFKTIVKMYEDGTPVDLVTINNRIADDGLGSACGGQAYVASLTDGVPRSINLKYYVDIIKEKFTLRQLIDSAKRLQTSCMDLKTPSREIISNLEREIFDISEGRSKSDYSIIKDLTEGVVSGAEERHKAGCGMSGITSGFIDIDRITGGFKKGSLVIIAARPSVGKSSLCLNMAINAAIIGKTVGIFSIEDSKEYVAKRTICSMSRISSMDMDCGRLSRSDWSKLIEYKAKIDALPIFVDDSPATVLEIKTKARRMKNETGELDMIIVDYLQLMRSVDGSSSENRARELAIYTQYLKALAKELDIPIIVASQLNRGIESRAGGKPKLADLRESGAIEQDADVVAFLVKRKKPEDEIVDPDPYDPSVVDVYFEKHRNGPTGVAELVFFPAYTRFENKAKD